MAMPITPDMIAPQLRDALDRMPKVPLRSALFRNLASILMKLRRAPELPGVRLEVRSEPPRRVYLPEVRHGSGALLWIHGGGYIIGDAAIDDILCAEIALTLGIVVVSAEYRLAPRHPHPAALDDCHAVWQAMQAEAGTLGVSRDRIVVGGMSAGGGLAATLVQRLHDEGADQPAGQLLFAPMLDDRTAANRELDAVAHPVWDNRLNCFGWQSYLGRAPGGASTPSYAAAARRRDVAGLPPTWIGVGSIELFHDEDVEYAARLQAAGVHVSLEVVQGAPHGFEAWGRDTTIGRAHLAKAIDWLGEVVG